MFYYMKRHWKINSLAAVLGILEGGLRVYLNILMMYVFEGILSLNMERFLFWSVVELLSWGIYCGLDGLRVQVESAANRAMNNHIRADMVATIQSKNHRQFHAQQTGEYISMLTNDVNQIESLAWDSVSSIISLVSQIIFSIIALFTMHWSLLVASAVVSVIIILTPSLFQKKMEKLGEELTTEQSRGTSTMKDLLSGLEVLRSFGQSRKFQQGNQDASDKVEKAKYKLQYKKGYLGEVINLISLVCQTLVIFLVGVLAILGALPASAVMSAGNIAATIYNGLASVSGYFLSISSCKPYFEKITVHAEKEQKNAEAPALPPVQRGITVENLSFSYEGKPVLENASFQFRKGGKYALTGPSGCGKSTLLKLVLGWLPEYTGRIAFDGQDAKSFSPDQLQQQMSYIEQDVFLFNTTIRENITLGQEFTQQQLDKALRDSALDNDLKNMPLGLDTPVGEDGSCLSGGQKQRVAIARALIHNRSILLVDEGTSALDQKNADIVEQSLLQNPDLTLILVSHHLTPDRKAQFDQVYCLEPVLAQ